MRNADVSKICFTWSSSAERSRPSPT
jgi:hypothetical protein